MQPRAFISKHKQLTATRTHFFEVGLQLLNQIIARRNRHHRHVCVHQCQRPVFQLARRIALGVNIGNLFELEGAFQRDRELLAAPQKQCMAFLNETL